jgi:hypothetical protein
MKNFINALAYAFTLGFFLVIATLAIGKIANAGPVETVLDALVNIKGGATGSIVAGKSGRHYILTNWHVCWMESDDDSSLTGTLTNGERVTGMIVLRDAVADLCAVRIHDDTPTLTLAKDQTVRDVMTFGYPEGILTESHGFTKERFQWSYEVPIELVRKCPENTTINYYHDGTVKSCTIHWVNVLTNLYSRGGSSGSPIVDDSGLLVSVMTSQGGVKQGEFSGGIVPPELVKAFLEKL